MKLKLIPTLKTLGRMALWPLGILSAVFVIGVLGKYIVLICFGLFVLLGLVVWFVSTYRKYDPEFDKWCKENLDSNYY